MIALSFPSWLRAALLLAAAGANPALVPPAPEADGAAVRVLIETMVIDRRGTWSAGMDQADLIPGAAGVLKKSITLEAKDGRRTKEPIEIEARLVPGARQPDGPACALSLAIETRAASAAESRSTAPGGGKTRAAGTTAAPAPGRRVGSVTSVLSLADGEERLVDAYVSPKSGNKVAFRVRCGEARHEEDAGLEMVAIDLEVERRVEGESPSIIGDQKLVALLGREVSATVSDHTTLDGETEDDGARFRRERLDLTLSPVVAVAGRLQLRLRVEGEVATVGAARTVASHPIERTESFLVAPLEARSIEIVLPGSAAEGWKDLHFLIQIRAHF